jgi:hypothetical protein
MREVFLSVGGVVACLLIVWFGVPLMVFGTLYVKARTK